MLSIWRYEGVISDCISRRYEPVNSRRMNHQILHWKPCPVDRLQALVPEGVADDRPTEATLSDRMLASTLPRVCVPWPPVEPIDLWRTGEDDRIDRPPAARLIISTTRSNRQRA